MRSVSNVFKMSMDDPASSHITKYQMNMKPSAFSDTRSKKSEKYNCFIVCKDMRQSFYLLKVMFFPFIKHFKDHFLPSFSILLSLLIHSSPCLFFLFSALFFGLFPDPIFFLNFYQFLCMI